MSRKRLVLPLLLTACALAACGRRGPLEPPPGSAPPPRAQAALIDPTGQNTGAGQPSLSRNTAGDASLAPQGALAPATPITVPTTPFFLDPLL